MSDESSGSFSDVMNRLRGRDDDAAARVFNQFAQRLIALARSRLYRDVRQKVDPEDVVQSVFNSFYVRFGAGNFDVECWKDVWALLVAITVRKCGRWNERFSTLIRDVKRERSLEGAGPADQSHAAWQPPAETPAPDEVAALADLVETLMERLGPVERQILVLRLQGYTAQETSEQADCSLSKVYRVMDRVKARVQRLGEEAFG